MNRFEMKNGRLQHFIHDELRAVVEPEHLSDYVLSADLDPDLIPTDPATNQEEHANVKAKKAPAAPRKKR